jgi:hypothetical protein
MKKSYPHKEVYSKIRGRRFKFKKKTIIFIVDLLILASFFLVFFTGIIKFPNFINLYDPGSIYLLRNIHDFNGILMTFLIFAHLILHWKSIIGSTKKVFRGKKESNYFINHGFNRYMADYIINVGLLITLFLVATSGVLKLPGLLMDLGLFYTLSGILTPIHYWSGLIMGILALSHVLLNWRFLLGYSKRLLRMHFGKERVVSIGFVSMVLTAGIPIIFSFTNFNYSSTTGVFLIDNTGVYPFRINEVQTLRPELFKPGHFSLFDILAYLDQKGDLDAEYYFNASMNTYVIESINGKEDWWYSA